MEQAAHLSLAEQAALLRLARRAVERAVGGRPDAAEEPSAGVERTTSLGEARGAFVTLRVEGRLRGCIGEIRPIRPLWRVVEGSATSAATCDLRFARIRPRELDRLTVHVSVLTAPRPVDSWRDIVLGRHGIVLQARGRTATFLPQVATEQGWDLATTLSRLAEKAGLAPDAWRDDAELLVFETQAFGEGQGRT